MTRNTRSKSNRFGYIHPLARKLSRIIYGANETRISTLKTRKKEKKMKRERERGRTIFYLALSFGETWFPIP